MLSYGQPNINSQGLVYWRIQIDPPDLLPIIRQWLFNRLLYFANYIKH